LHGAGNVVAGSTASTRQCVKSVKMHMWASRCPLALDHQDGHWGYQNGASRSPKYKFCTQKWPISESHQPAVACSQGAGGRGEAFKQTLSLSLSIYIYNTHPQLIRGMDNIWIFLRYGFSDAWQIFLCMFQEFPFMIIKNVWKDIHFKHYELVYMAMYCHTFPSPHTQTHGICRSGHLEIACFVLLRVFVSVDTILWLSLEQSSCTFRPKCYYQTDHGPLDHMTFSDGALASLKHVTKTNQGGLAIFQADV